MEAGKGEFGQWSPKVEDSETGTILRSFSWEDSGECYRYSQVSKDNRWVVGITEDRVLEILAIEPLAQSVNTDPPFGGLKKLQGIQIPEVKHIVWLTPYSSAHQDTQEIFSVLCYCNDEDAVKFLFLLGAISGQVSLLK